MEKSIESIWKQGFLSDDALVAPKLNNLYNQKSIHLIEKFKRMFRINLYAIAVGSLLFLVASFLIGSLFLGIGFFLTLGSIALVNRKLYKGLGEIDTSENTYRYIGAFDQWVKQLVRVNKWMARCYYPLFFLFTIVGFWQYRPGGMQWGESITHTLVRYDLGSPLFVGVPVLIIGAVAFLMLLLAFLGGRIYDWDFKVIYGAECRKLDELISDMRELSSERI
ncbi:hypothetical protein [Cyclobacterium xiamenense]|jgi:hypothetical protein|uniref:hypothetical protein n=1 Tax=Cyclobacterium xiamenense TaxID=1297121 RepID=UPI0035CFB237